MQRLIIYVALSNDAYTVAIINEQKPDEPIWFYNQ